MRCSKHTFYFLDKVFGVSVVRQLGEDFYTTPTTTTTQQGFVTPGPTYTTVMASSLDKRDLSSRYRNLLQKALLY